MPLDEALDAIEGAQTIDELRHRLHTIVQKYGFNSFAFVDISGKSTASPSWMASSNQSWNSDYERNRFFESDPIVSTSRRTNIPFSWDQVPLPPRRGKRKPVAHRLMEAAFDHGFNNGLAIPFHYVDRLGQVKSKSSVLFWSDKRKSLSSISRQERTELHLIMIYWMHKLLQVESDNRRGPRHVSAPLTEQADPALTDRERQVLEWAARGKTVVETAIILSISSETVESHIRSAIRRLDASNKTNAAIIALRKGLIDV